MDSNVLKNSGFSLFELSLVLTILTIVILAVFYSSGKIRQGAVAERAMNELEAIAKASLEYYSANNTWPVSMSDLLPTYLAGQADSVNPFGNAYTITPGNNAVSVSTLLPKGLVTAKNFGSEVVVVNQGSNDLVSVTKSFASTIWSLKYEKKNVYKQ